ncbi:MAG: hypothetical protein JRD89_01155 [Deltaproteobacteria bacterium]|nr:hypothetical protein [Deltaproteobacteria bacterium]
MSPYPKKRKSPYRHKVRAHKRKGRPVRSYERGKGPKPRDKTRSRRRASALRPARRSTIVKRRRGYEVEIYLPDGVEEVPVDSPDHVSALRRARPPGSAVKIVWRVVKST